MLALDLQVLQKVLPKLHGSRQRLAEPLGRLLWFTTFHENPSAMTELRDEHLTTLAQALGTGRSVRHPTRGEQVAWLPRSAGKLARMLRTLRAQGFVSFIE
jgi:hypothetical protein